MTSRKKKIPAWGMVSVGILCLVLSVRYFLIGSYRVSTYAMEEALHKGDYILVDKLPAKKLLKRHQVVLFTSPLQKDKEKPALALGRCVALPGDTIQVGQDGYTVNGTLYPRSPYALTTYTINKQVKGLFLDILRKLGIPQREMKDTDGRFTLNLTPFEEYQIREETDRAIGWDFAPEEIAGYTLVVPQKDRNYRLTESFLTAGREAIIAETGGQAVFREGRLLIGGKEVTSFRFENDYYWILSDNTGHAVDSRHLGFIPAGCVVGKAWFCWYSKDKRHRFGKVK